MDCPFRSVNVFCYPATSPSRWSWSRCAPWGRVRVPGPPGRWHAGRGDPLPRRGGRSSSASRPKLPTSVKPVDAESLRLLVESARIRLAYTHDRHFAVSLSGIRTLPHQIEAVYLRMLPQPRLRFLLADDPGAGKTIMAGLLIKEMKLREAIDRVLILCPAPLTIQWQDELLRWFGESFDIIFSAVDQQQLVNPWQRASTRSSPRSTTPSRTTSASGSGANAGTWSSSTRPTSAAPTPRAAQPARRRGGEDQALPAGRAPGRELPTTCSCSPPRRTTATTTASPTSSGSSTPTCSPSRTGSATRRRRSAATSSGSARIARGLSGGSRKTCATCAAGGSSPTGTRTPSRSS